MIRQLVDAAAEQNDKLAKVHLDALGQHFVDQLAMKHTSSSVDLDGTDRLLLHFMPWALVSNGRLPKSCNLKSLDLDDEDVRVVERKLQQISAMPKLQDHGALLLFPSASRKLFQLSQRLHAWQVSAAQAIVALIAFRTSAGGSGGSGGAGRLVLTDPAATKNLFELMDARDAVVGVLPTGDEDAAALPASVSKMLLTTARSSPHLLKEAQEVTKLILDSYVGDSCQVLQDKNAQMSKLVPLEDFKFMLVPAGLRDTGKILGEVLNNHATSAAIQRTV